MTEQPTQGEGERPAWFVRRQISPFTLPPDVVNRIVGEASHAVVSWVTRDNEPVQAVMLYVVIEDLITVTSTTNRAKCATPGTPQDRDRELPSTRPTHDAAPCRQNRQS